MNILHIDASCRHEGSASRELSQKLVDKIKPDGASVVYRDLSQGMPFVDDAMIDSYVTPSEDRTTEQKQAVEFSDEIVAEILNADVLVIGIPIYNFSMPAVFKAWCDLAARAGVTFKYTPDGPVGLTEGKKAYVTMTSGGTPIGSDIDFLSPWLIHYLKFIGIVDVTVIGAQGQRKDYGAETLEKANQQIDQLDAL
ncbi:UNVERIFIED_CONTAM: hypothetical protein GTU68_046679 [Idotea baltica]|nr:hypothetical protein [Idotea baltica]